MFDRNLTFIRIILVLFLALFLMGQAGSCVCTDNDGDGYGSPSSGSCTYPEPDCDDDPSDDPPICATCTCDQAACTQCAMCINPGENETPYGDPMCGDNVDNDCDGFIDDTPGGCSEWSMAQIPGGCFEMGDHFDEGPAWDGQTPVHTVCLTAFEMDFHEVTNAEYALCVNEGTCAPPLNFSSISRPSYYNNPDYDDYPVMWVDIYMAREYCAWAGKRMPTEAEWEHAGRGGLIGMRYPSGNTITHEEANYRDGSDPLPWDTDTTPVESYPPNGYGLYDMAGNVWEWNNDQWRPDYYQECHDQGTVNNPTGPTRGLCCGVRGGAWSITDYYLRVSFREIGNIIEGINLGFRCARGGAYGP